MGRKLPLIATVMIAFLLGGCPPTLPPRNLSIHVTSVNNNNSGLFFFVSGTNFTPNGQVNIRLFNVGTTFRDFTNAPGLPNLSADASGNFPNFSVNGRCSDIFADNLPFQSLNPELWVIDVATTSIAKQTFAPVICLFSAPLPPNPPRNCPADIPQSQCH
jgi:hypothetical protein